MKRMSEAEAREFFNGGRRTGKVGTLRADGSPHVVPVCVTWEGDEVIFTTWHATVKARNLARDPRVSVCVDEGDTFVQVNGVARVEEDLGELRRVWLKLGARYMGPEHAEAAAERNAVPGELLVRVRPTSIVAIRDIAE